MTARIMVQSFLQPDITQSLRLVFFIGDAIILAHFKFWCHQKNHSRQGSIQVYPNKLISKQFSVNTNIYRGETTCLTHILTINVYKIATII